MKEIEDNVVPFGYIDDGQAHIEVLEGREKDHWQVKEFDPELAGADGIFNRDL